MNTGLPWSPYVATSTNLDFIYDPWAQKVPEYIPMSDNANINVAELEKYIAEYFTAHEQNKTIPAQPTKEALTEPMKIPGVKELSSRKLKTETK